jgi:membrane-associated phospholipid phosphatase
VLASPPARRLPPVLGALGVAAVGVILLLGLGFAAGRWPFGFDAALVTGLRAWGGPGWLRHAARDLTALGGGPVLTLAVVLAAGLLLVRRLPLTAGAVVLAAVSGNLVVDAIKGHVARARPALVPHLVEVSNYSFPSGHAANSAIVWLTLATLGSQVTPAPAARTYLLGAAALLVGLIGASRVYLGVHWPSDVLAGWSLGVLWALLWWWLLARARTLVGGER